MMEVINCPVCGQPNPSDLELCQHCDQPLYPTTTELNGGGELIHPGEKPTKKVTAELEHALPAWLRGARKGEKKDAAENNEQAEEPTEKTSPPPTGELLAPEEEEELPNWLDGLDAEADDDDDENPDWLANLQTDTPNEIEPSETPEDDLSTEEEAITATSAPVPSKEDEPRINTGDLPGWLSDLQAEASTITAGAQPEDLPDLLSTEETPASQDELVSSDQTEDQLPDWLSTLSAKETSAAMPSAETPSVQPASVSTPESTPEQRESEPAPASEVELPDWISDLKPEADAAEEPVAEGLPEWISESAPEQEEVEAAPIEGSELPDWMANLQPEGDAVEGTYQAPPALASTDELAQWIDKKPSPTAENDLPDWISDLPAEDAGTEEASLAEDAPEWLTSQSESEPLSDPAVVEAATESAETSESEMPDWLSKMGKPLTGSLSEEGPNQSAAPSEGDAPEWLSSLPAVEQEIKGQVETEEDTEPALIMSDDDFDFSSDDDNVDAILDMEMPDWLSSLEPDEVETPAPTGDAAATDSPADGLDSAKLPSWVQAMRPVADILPASADATAEEHMVEQVGPLAGFNGILPVGPGIGTIRKPKAHSIKLSVSESQQASAALLEDLLASESEPSSFTTPSKAFSIRFLRWTITLLLFFAVGSSVFSGTQVAPMPKAVPEVGAVLDTIGEVVGIINALPTDAPTLLVFDYEPGLSGELDAAAAPVIDHLMLRGSPLAILSTSPTGSALAERFLQNTQASHNYQYGQQYINLGYLPGGSSGILSFASQPRAAIRTDIEGALVWDSLPLQGVASLADFAALIVLTDSVETGRAWIEQTGETLGETPLLMVVSAQAEPIIYPYYKSGQIDGLVSGLSGGATYERINGRPGLGRAYWDAFSIGLLLAEILIAIGGMLSLLAALNARQKSPRDED